jgi:hypothetical protein
MNVFNYTAQICNVVSPLLQSCVVQEEASSISEDDYNIRMDLGEVRCGCVGTTGLARYRDRWRVILDAVMNLRVP